MGRRRRARELALQAIYALEISGDPIEQVIGELIDPIEDAEVVLFAAQLVRFTIQHHDQLDGDIALMLENWEYKRVALIDRLILRLAACELVGFPEIPPKVTMNEGIDLAKKFSTAESGRFVNGILDALFKKYKDENKFQKTGRGLL